MPGYSYTTERAAVFTESGQVMFLRIRDHAQELLKASGAAMMGAIIENQSGNSWSMLACVDRLVELGELREIPQEGGCAGQHRIFVSGKRA